jgi:cell shape-determining protein MreC
MRIPNEVFVKATGVGIYDQKYVNDLEEEVRALTNRLALASTLDRENRALKKELEEAKWNTDILDSLTNETLQLREQVSTLIRVLGSRP